MITDSRYADVVAAAAAHATDYLAGVPSRRVVPLAAAADLESAFGGPLAPQGMDPVAVVDELARIADPGLTTTASGRFFGFVVGGALPAGVGAQMLATAWDQNAALRALAPAAVAAENAVAAWSLDLLGLPPTAQVGLVPGGMSANFTCLAAARHRVLAARGWDVERAGLTGAPRVHVLCGTDRHETVDRALRFLGLGAATPVGVDEQGRMRPEALAVALARVPTGAPIIACLSAGHIHSGAYDRYEDLVPLVHQRGGWVHVDGAIGLWAAASTPLRHLTAGMATADSWATDAHKTLNVPYDCGMAIVADGAALSGAMAASAAYVVSDASGALEPTMRTPEWSRRARGFAVWAVLRSLGGRGVDELISRLHHNAVAMAGLLADIPGVEVLHEVVSTQVSFAVGDDARTRATVEQIMTDGGTWISGSRWRDRAVIRVSMSNWSTDATDLDYAAAVVRTAVRATGQDQVPAGRRGGG